ncbi:exopolysaccharide biosynthesis protein [Rugamonas sp. FT107W]|uniref:Exopolysaccharide biosynthesis protein n=1 Tax=Duganella vulcania TaxID=2692166 RepID=A0A845HJT0_9BURK|nr:polysaccharide pyruvyl transferase family protein [Duganella vulcania]MYN17673.1 exopolysaccharide biosynthesis protein [Duganella vulcania]
MSKHADIMSGLAAKHEVLLPLLTDRPLHYLDLPFHGNVGDLLIMNGTLRFFEKYRLNVARLGMYFNYSPQWAEQQDVIVFHGGGNFGDIYGPFQAFRERIIAALPRNRIVIMPQTIHFADPAKFQACCALLSAHPDLHICVRDQRSAALARQMTPHVYLLPDMAHQLWPIERAAAPTRPVLYLRRRDSEAQAGALDQQGNTFDWEDLIGKNWGFFLPQVAERSMYHAQRLGINKPFANLEGQWWIGQARRFIARSVALFSQYERVESDRLHAHILSSLLSIPNRISDNSYGKNSNYIAEWTHGSELLELVPPPRAAAAGGAA